MIVSAIAEILPATVATAALGAALFFRLARPRWGWKWVNVKGDFTLEHHLPDQLPVPAKHAKRAAEGDFSFEEALDWVRLFVKRRRRHPLLQPLRLALQKVEFYRKLAESMGQGRWGEVDQLAQNLASLDPLDPSAQLARGRAMRQLGHLSSAVHYYRQALKLQPTHSVALPELAATCRLMGRPRQFYPALEAARKELGETHPLTIESRVQLGELVRIFADPTDPATVAHIPRNQYLQNLRLRLENMDYDPENVLHMGQSLLNDDFPEMVQMLLDQTLERQAASAPLLLLRGMLQTHQRQLISAEKSLRLSLEREDSAQAHLELGRALSMRAQRPKAVSKRPALDAEARQHLRLAIDRDPNLGEAISLLVQLEKPGTEAQIQRLMQPLCNAYPQAWGPWRVLGDLHMVRDELEAARQAYQQGLRRQNHDALLLPHLMVLDRMGNTEELLKAAQRIGNLAQRDPSLRWRVAQIYCQHQKLKEAADLLVGLIREEQAPAWLRQQAREILSELEESKEKAE